MFEKSKARFAELEKTNEDFRKVKKHLQDNQKLYIGVPIALGVGILVGKHYQRPIEVTVTPTFNNVPTIAPVFNNHNIGNVVENTINNVGHLHKIVKRVKPDGTEELYETITDAAKALAPEYGIKAASVLDRISKVANGYLPNYRDDQFFFVGTGTR